MLLAATSSLLILLLLLLRHRLDVVWLESSELLLLGGVEPLVPDNHAIELFPRNEHVVELLERLELGVHHPEHEEAIALDLLDEVAVEGQRLQGRDARKLLRFLKVLDVVSMKVQGLQVREEKKLLLDSLEVVVREVEPLELLGLPHHVVEDVAETLDGANFVVV